MKSVRQFLIATGMWMTLMGSLSGMGLAHAAEGIQEVALSAQQKSSLVSFLKARIAKHKAMKSSGDIIADLSSAMSRNRAAIAKRGQLDLSKWDKATLASIDQLKAIGDKDAIIAMETAELQKVMTSGNIMFFASRAAMNETYMVNCTGEGPYDRDCDCYDGPSDLAVLWLVFTVPFDLVTLPFTFIGSALTGF